MTGGEDAGNRPAERKAPPERPEPVREAHRKMCALFDACRDDGSDRGLRDAALLSVLYGAGVPRPTALRLPLAAYDPRRAVLTWRDPGPVGRRRARRAADGAREALADWLEARGTAHGPLLCRLEGRTEAPRPLREADVTSVLERWRARAGVDEVDETELRRLYTSPWWGDAAGRETQG